MPIKRLIKVTDQRKWNGGIVKLYVGIRPVIEAIEAELKRQDFRVQYLSEQAMHADRIFEFPRPFRKSGTMEWVFFEYGDHITVSYKLRPGWGVSWATLLFFIPSAGSSLIALTSVHGSKEVVLLALALGVVLIYQKISTLLYLRKLAEGLLGRFRTAE